MEISVLRSRPQSSRLLSGRLHQQMFQNPPRLECLNLWTILYSLLNCCLIGHRCKVRHGIWEIFGALPIHGGAHKSTVWITLDPCTWNWLPQRTIDLAMPNEPLYFSPWRFFWRIPFFFYYSAEDRREYLESLLRECKKEETASVLDDDALNNLIARR